MTGLPAAEEDTLEPFAGALQEEERDGVERLIVMELKLLAPPPRPDDQPIAVGVTIDPPIGLNQLHGYVAKCTASAYASVHCTAGGVRLRVTRNGYTVGLATVYAGATCASVGASTPTKATFDVAVRGLYNGSYYTISAGWVVGSGGGC